MDESLLVILQEKSDTFSKGQKLLARYISESYEQAAFMTAAKLGETVGISESTVVRFAGLLGFSGYPGLQKAMQQLAFGKTASVQEISALRDDTDAVSNVFYLEMENLRQTAMFLDKNVLDNIVRAIEKSEDIYIVGSKINRLLAEYLGYYLQFVFENVHIVTDSGTLEMLESLLHVGRKSVVIGIQFPEYSAATDHAVKYCSGTGATVIGLTDGKSASFSKCCDYILQAKCDKYAFTNPVAAPFTLINALILAVTDGRNNLISKRSELLDNISNMYNV